ncbi:MAG: DUF3293 domain-containing protein [Gemmatimonadota bacterium]
MSDDTLWVAYARTRLLIGPAPHIKVDLRQPVSDDLRHLLTNLGLGSTFAVVTPFDPRGKRAPAWRNRVRYLRMRRQLRSRNLNFVEADGESPDSVHRERGFAIGISRNDAATLAREHQQLALYWFDGEFFWIDGVLAPRAPQRLP